MKKLLSLANKELTSGSRPLDMHPADSGRTTELEIRLGKIPIASYNESLALLRSGTGYLTEAEPEPEKTLSVISPDKDAPFVLRKSFPTQVIVLMRKRKEAQCTGTMAVDSTQCGYKVTLSSEEVIKNARGPRPEDVVRLRKRTSRMIELDGHIWSVEVTLIRETTFQQISQNTMIKTAFFEKQEGASHYEVEIEMIKCGQSAITEEHLRNAALHICRIAYPRGIDVGVAKSPRELLIRTVARLISRRDAHERELREITLKNILNNAESLTKQSYLHDVFPMEGYYATDKADGERGLAVIDINGAIAIITDTMMFGSCDIARINDIYDGEVMVAAAMAATAPAATAPSASAPAPSTTETAPTGKNVMFYAFDCLWSGGESLISAPFESRVAMIDSLESATATHEQIVVRPKEFQVLRAVSMQKTIEDLYNRKTRQYPIDGLIFTQPGVDYFATKNYKWKPMTANTIDFLCLRCPEKLYGSHPYVLPREANTLSASALGRSEFRIYLLFCACSERQRAEYCIQPLPFHDEIIAREMRNNVIHFACMYEPLAYVLILKLSDMKDGVDIHGKVVEMRWRASSELQSDEDAHGISDPWRHWDLLRIRPDRQIGNNIHVATSVFANYVNPFPLEALWRPTAGYFAKETEGGFVASNKYRRFILTMIIYNNLHEVARARVLDLGGGRAQEFVRYAAAGASLMVNFDVDAMAITESVVRVEDQARGRHIANSMVVRWLKNLGARVGETGQPGECTVPVYIGRVIDILKLAPDSFEASLKSIGLSARMFDAVVSSFAFHYFCVSKEAVERVFALINIALNDASDRDGKIIITTMNGERVFELLKQNGGVWKGIDTDSGSVKYEIHALYEPLDTPRLFGQMIRVSVPFSEELYEEPLCNFAALREIATAAGFNTTEVIDYGSDSLLTLLQKADPELARKLSPIDREYTSLFSTIIFKRAAKSRAGRGRARVKK